MDSIRFILVGEDKSSLACVKNALCADGHNFIGYSANHSAILRLVRNLQPELVIIEPCSPISELRQSLEIMDEELLAACILLTERRKDEILDLTDSARAISYITKPVHPDVVLQIADITLSNYKRVTEYEGRLKKLNDAIETRKVVEKAKWILVQQEGISEADAYDRIRKLSRDGRSTMKATAEVILNHFFKSYNHS